MAHYVAFIHKDEDSCYGVSFPDFPGCISAGNTYDEAWSDAIEALRVHVELMRDDGDEIPAPSALEAVMADPDLSDHRAGAVLAMVPLFAIAGRPKRVNVSIDADVLDAIDDLAAHAGQTRSGFLTYIARQAAEDSWEAYKDKKDKFRWRRLASNKRIVGKRSDPTPSRTPRGRAKPKSA